MKLSITFIYHKFVALQTVYTNISIVKLLLLNLNLDFFSQRPWERELLWIQFMHILQLSPLGIIVAAPMYAATNSRLYSIGYATLSGFSEPLGAILAVLLYEPINKIFN